MGFFGTKMCTKLSLRGGKTSKCKKQLSELRIPGRVVYVEPYNSETGGDPFTYINEQTYVRV
jgi:hypothetical protein